MENVISNISTMDKTFKDLIEFEPYFKAIVECDITEIKNCLVEFAVKYSNLPLDKRIIFNLRYEIGLILACLSLDERDVDIFEQIFLPASSVYKRFIPEINPLSILTQLKKFRLTDVVIGYYIEELSKTNCSEHIVAIILGNEEKNQGITEARIRDKLTISLQSYKHIKRYQNLNSKGQ